MASQNYNASSIKVLPFPDSVRTRPDMYIGDRAISGWHHCAFEIIDNSVDEHLNGSAFEITVRLLSPTVIEVEDNGRGIPIDIHTSEKVPTVELVMTKLHAGGKFDRDAYQVSGGLHGVGLSVVNALSRFMDVEIYRDGQAYTIRYERGIRAKALENLGSTTKQGTLVRFEPDLSIFQHDHFSPYELSMRLREIAFLNPGLKVRFINHLERHPQDPSSPAEHLFVYEDGIRDFLDHEVNADHALLLDQSIRFAEAEQGIHFACAMQYRQDGEDTLLYSYTNSIHTRSDGLHVDAFWTAYEKVMQSFAQRLGIDKKGDKIHKQSLSFGLTCIINTRIPNAEFKGQTKDKLTEPANAKTICRDMTERALFQYFETHMTEAKRILDKAITELNALQAAKKARENAKTKNLSGKKDLKAIAGKLADCSSRKPEERELFIVEGDSAGGSAKQGRNREFQAILPLRGKILNIQKKVDQKASSSIFANEEIKTLIAVIRAGYAQHFDLDKLSYHKVIIMTDADVDGAHIQTLLLTFFYRFMRKLIDEGHLYIAQPPLYKITQGKQLQYAYGEHDKESILQSPAFLNKKSDIQRYKGLGEMNPDQLWETTMDPYYRKLLQVSITDAAQAEHLLELLMSDKHDPAKRKDFILSNANFVTQIDDIG